MFIFQKRQPNEVDDIVLVSLTLNTQFFGVSIINFEQVNAGWKQVQKYLKIP